ncbi:MAG TPA: zinc ribbon domain-containing protein [Spirochaetes bacterium]|nr:zinc ribbon domain-containing protein [Spirochaetota bacterium]
MPTYDYECLGCGKNFEVYQGMKDEPVIICPQCGGRVRRRISGGAGFIMRDAGPSSPMPSCGREQTCCGSDRACGRADGCGFEG